MNRLMIVLVKKICATAICLLPAIGASQSLIEAVQIALGQYPTILEAQSRVQAADYQIMEAQSGHWPQLEWQGTKSVYNNVTPGPFQPNNTWIQSPAVSLNIWSGWRIQSQVDRARAVHDGQRQTEDITRDEVAFMVVQAYLNWVRLGLLVDLAQQNLARHERLVSDVSQIAAVDQGRRIDVTQAQVRAESARLSLEQFVAERDISAERLRRMLLGLLPSHPSGYDEILGQLPSSQQAAIALLDDSHPVIARQLSEIEVARSTVANAKSRFSPSVDLSYQRQTTQGTGQGDYATLLNVRVPLFDGGSAFGATRSAYAELEASKHGLIEARLALRENLLSAWSEHTIAKQRVALGARQVDSAQELVAGYEEQFRVGRRSLLDLLTIQDNLFSYQINLTDSAFQQRTAKAKIMAVLNQLASTYEAADNAVRADNKNSTTFPGAGLSNERGLR